MKKSLKKIEKKCSEKDIIQWNACNILMKQFKNVKMNGSMNLVRRKENFLKNVSKACIRKVILKI